MTFPIFPPLTSYLAQLPSSMPSVNIYFAAPACMTTVRPVPSFVASLICAMLIEAMPDRVSRSVATKYSMTTTFSSPE